MPNATRQDTRSQPLAGAAEFPKAPAPGQAPPAMPGLVRFTPASAGDCGGVRRMAGRAWRAAGHFATTFALGIAVFFAWPLGDAARVVIAAAAPQLWLAGHDRGDAAPVVVPGAGPAAIAGPQPADPRPPDLAAMRERIVTLAASTEAMTRAVADLAAGQARLEREVARTREVEAELAGNTAVQQHKIQGTRTAGTSTAGKRTTGTRTAGASTAPSRPAATAGTSRAKRSSPEATGGAVPARVPVPESKPAGVRQAAR